MSTTGAQGTHGHCCGCAGSTRAPSPTLERRARCLGPRRVRAAPRSRCPPPAPRSPVAHILLKPLTGFLCSPVLGTRRNGDGTTRTLLLPRRHDLGEPAAPAGAQHGLCGHEDALADACNGPLGRWGHLSRTADAASVAAR